MYENTKVYHDQNGDRLVVDAGGTLLIKEGANFVAEGGSGVGQGANGVVTELGGGVHHTKITLTNQAVPTVDAGAAGAAGSADLYSFPRGLIKFVGATSNLTLVGDGVGLTATSAVVTAVGSVAAAADATLTATEADFIPSTISTLVASAGVMKGKYTTDKLFDNTTTTNATALKAKLNVATPDAGSTANGVLTVSGTVDLFWINLGDN